MGSNSSKIGNEVGKLAESGFKNVTSKLKEVNAETFFKDISDAEKVELKGRTPSFL